MMGHKICFNGEIWLIVPKLTLLPVFIVFVLGSGESLTFLLN